MLHIAKEVMGPLLLEKGAGLSGYSDSDIPFEKHPIKEPPDEPPGPKPPIKDPPYPKSPDPPKEPPEPPKPPREPPNQAGGDGGSLPEIENGYPMNDT